MPRNKLQKPDKQDADDNVKVVVRCRPLNKKEIEEGHKQSIIVDEIRGTITVTKLKTPQEQPRTFTYDTVFGPNSKQLDIYNLTARPIVDSVLEGYNGTIFAYGQTGTGKTFTMEGVGEVPELRGIIPNSFVHIYDHIAKAEGDKRFSVHVSYLEIYNEEVWDLLHTDKKQRLEVKERPDIGAYVKDLSRYAVHRAGDMDKIMRLGHKNRSVGATNMNEHSSRSHAIFTITLGCSEKGVDGKQHERIGKLHLVDLAGSERQDKSGATGQRLKEATKINLSLSTLGNVISALVDGKSTHVPYRNSKLTRLLQDSLGGNSKTLMCANIGPADYNFDETISTLGYASRAKQIKNKAKMNVDPDHALLLENDKECEELQKQLDEIDKKLAAELEEKKKIEKAGKKRKKAEQDYLKKEYEFKKYKLDQDIKWANEERMEKMKAVDRPDLSSDFRPRQKLRTAKASNRQQLFHALHELRRTQITYFETSDDESEQGRKKSVSYLKTQRIRSPSEDPTASDLCDNKLSDSSISRYIDDDDPFSRQSNDETKVEGNVTKADQYSDSGDFCENGEDLLSDSKPSKKLSKSKASNRNQPFQATNELKKSKINGFEISDNESKKGRKKRVSNLKTQRIRSPSEDTTASELCDNKLSDSTISRYIDDDDPFSRQSNDETKVEANVTKVDQYSYSNDFCENGEDLLSNFRPSQKLRTANASNRQRLFHALHERRRTQITYFETSDDESEQGRKKSVSNLKTQRIRSPSEDTTASELCDNKLSDSSISQYIDDDDPFSRQSKDETKVEANVTKVDQYSYSDDFFESGDDLLSDSKPSNKLSKSKASNRNQLFQATNELKKSKINGFEISDNESKKGRKKRVSNLKTQRIRSPSEDTTASELCDNKLSDSTISRYIDDDDPFSRQSNDETKVEANVTKVDQYSYSDDFCENGEDLLSNFRPSQKLRTAKASNRQRLFHALHERRRTQITYFETSDDESEQGRKKSVSNLKTQRIRSPSEDTTASDLCDNKLSDSSISQYIDDDDPFSRQSNDVTKVEANVTKVDQYSYSDDFCENGEDLLSDSKPSKKLSKSKASNRNQLFQATNELKKSKINGFEISDNESKKGRKKRVSNLKTQRIRSPSEDTTASDLCDNKLSDSTISRYIDDDDPFSRQSNDETKVEANVTKVDQYSYSDDFCENGEDLLSNFRPSQKLRTAKASNRQRLFHALHERRRTQITYFETSDDESEQGRKKSVSNLKTQRIRSPSEDTTASDLCDNKLSDSSISQYIDDDDPFSRQSNDETKVEANVTKVDQYSYSGDFCESGDDLLSDSKPSKKLRTAKASNRNQLFQATNELKKSKINGFEISDNESKKGRKKRVSNLKTQRIRSPSEDTTASELCDNKLSDSTISRYIDDDDPFSRQSNDETKVEANVTKVDQYSYSDDFCENGEDLLSDSKPSKKLSKSKAINRNQLFQATNELKKSKINGFEISDNESKQGRKKSVSNLKTQRIRSPSEDTTASELCDNKLSDSTISRYIDDDDPFSRQSNDVTKVEANVTKVDQYSYSNDFCENGEDLLSDSKPSKKLSKSKASNRNQLFQATNELKKSKINGFEISDNESKKGRKKRVSNLKTQRIRSPSEDTTASDLCDNKLSDSTISQYIDDDDPFSRQSNDETKVEANVTKVDQYSYSDDFCENGEDLLSDSKPSKKLSKSKAINRNQLFQATNELKKSKINGFEISDNESKQGRKKSVSNLKTQRIRSPSEDTTASELCDNKLSDSSISRYIDDDDPFSRQSNDETKVEANVTKVDQYSYSDDFCENGEDLLSDSKPSKKLSKSKASNRNQLFQATNELKKSKINGFEISDNESKKGRKKRVSNLKTQRIRSPSEDTTASDLCDNKLSDSTISQYIDDDDPFSRQSNDETKVEANVTKVDQYSYSDDFCENGEDLLSDSKPSKKLSKSKASNRNQLFQATNELKKSKFHNFAISDDESKQGRKKRVSNLKTQRIISSSEDTKASDLRENWLSYTSVSRYADDEDSSSTQHTKDKTQFKNRDGESALPCENNMMKPQGPAKKSNSFQVEHFRTPLLSAADFRLMSPAGNATEKKPPRPKSRQRTLGLSHQATEKIVRDLSRPQTSSASIPPSIDTSSNTAIRKSSPNNIGADPDQLSRGHEQLFDTRTTSSHSKTSKRPQVVHSRKVESKYFGSLEFLDEKVSLHESQAKSVNSLRATNYQAWIKKKQEELRENKKKERIMKEVKKKEEEGRREKAAAAFEEWEKKKVEGLKAKVKKPRARQSTEQDKEAESKKSAAAFERWIKIKIECLKAKAEGKQDMIRQEQRVIEEEEEERQSAGKDKEAEGKKSAAALERWIKIKIECLKAKAEGKQDMIRQEQRVIEEEEEERQSAGKTFEILKREHDYLLKETYRKQREDENYRLLIKHEEESIRKRKSKHAFSDWCKKKRDDLHEKVTMEHRAAEDKAEEERHLKAKTNRIALEEYEEWRARKARERRIQLEERQRPAVLRGSPRPPWIPPGNTIPFRSKRMQNIQFTSNY